MKILILSSTCEDIDDVIVIMITVNHVRFATQTRTSNSTKISARVLYVFGFLNCSFALSEK